MHAEAVHIDIDEVIQSGPIQPSRFLSLLMAIFAVGGALAFGMGLLSDNLKHTWSTYYVSLLFFMGISAGGVMITTIWQITRATWSAPLRRLAEANAAFLPVAYVLFLATYFGKEHLFPWANAPRPGTEWWMQPDFVYGRFAVLLGFLFVLMCRFVLLSLRGDIGMIKEKGDKKGRWHGWLYNTLTAHWRGTPDEVASIQPRLSWNAPVLVIVYAIIYSLFAFEMVMAMDKTWMSNLFGAFMFIGNIYMGWAVLAITAVYYCAKERKFNNVMSTATLWDLGKLTFGFCMLWGYFFFSQFLPQWYGNLPEETQYLIKITREYPWKGVGWFSFACAFILPFIMLLSRDLKKTPAAYVTVCFIILVGVYFEKYTMVMSHVTADHIPFGLTDIAVFLGFLGLYVLSIQTFMRSFPYVAISHPLTKGNDEW